MTKSYSKWPKISNTSFRFNFVLFFMKLFLYMSSGILFFFMKLFLYMSSGMANSVDPDQTAPSGAV